MVFVLTDHFFHLTEHVFHLLFIFVLLFHRWCCVDRRPVRTGGDCAGGGNHGQHQPQGRRAHQGSTLWLTVPLRPCCLPDFNDFQLYWLHSKQPHLFGVCSALIRGCCVHRCWAKTRCWTGWSSTIPPRSSRRKSALRWVWRATVWPRMCWALAIGTMTTSWWAMRF